jgi:hypothetical protein
MPSERGQTTAELMGVLALVALIVAALATSDLGRHISDAAQGAVCSIAAGGDCGDDAPEPDSLVLSGDVPPTDGPGFGGGPYPIPGIPWDGSVSVGERSTDDPGLYLEASVQHDRSKCRLDAEGKPMVELGVTGTLRTGAMSEKENRGKTGGVSVDAYVGRDVSYKISTDPERADRIADRHEEPPSPVDPTSIPPGSAVTLDEYTYAGMDLGVSYRGIQAEFGYNRGRKVSAAIERTDTDHVRLTVGDADLVQQTLALALGTEDANVSASSDKSLADGKTRQVDIDLNTPEGQRAYQSFIKTGALPEAGKGVANPRSSKVLEYNASTKLGGKLAGLEASLIDTDSSGQIVETTNPDGTLSVMQYAREGEVGLSHQLTVGADGEPGPSRYSLRLQDVPGSLAGALAKEAGLDYDDKNKDVTINFDDIDIRRMRTAAVDQLELHNPDKSRDEIKQLLAAGEDTALASPDRVALFIAMEDDPLEVAAMIARVGRGDSASAARWLSDFGGTTTMARHGGGRLGEHPEDAAIDDPKFTDPGC